MRAITVKIVSLNCGGARGDDFIFFIFKPHLSLKEAEIFFMIIRIFTIFVKNARDSGLLAHCL